MNFTLLCSAGEKEILSTKEHWDKAINKIEDEFSKQVNNNKQVNNLQ